MIKNALAVGLLLATGLVFAATPAKFGNWKVEKRVDKMTDEVVCTVQYTHSPRVWYTAENALTVSFANEGGVSSFRYRVDKQPASELRLAEQWGSRKFITMADFDDQFVNGQKLLVSGLTFVPERVFEVSVDLRGLADARREMRQLCNIKPNPWDTRAAPPAEPASH